MCPYYSEKPLSAHTIILYNEEYFKSVVKKVIPYYILIPKLITLLTNNIALNDTIRE